MINMISSALFTLLPLIVLAAGAALKSGQPCERSRIPYTLPHEEQCDAYFRCEDGVLSQELCDDGFVYHETDRICDMPQRVDCTDRPILQPAQGRGSCPRLNGFFSHAEYCDQYFYCSAGMASLITCPVGLVYDTIAAVCEFPDIALRPGCMPEEVLGFKCPDVVNTTDLAFGDHLRYAKEDDCRFFFKCMKNGFPRLGGCEMGSVFNPDTSFCEPAKNVKNCEHYYGSDDFDDDDVPPPKKGAKN